MGRRKGWLEERIGSAESEPEHTSAGIKSPLDRVDGNRSYNATGCDGDDGEKLPRRFLCPRRFSLGFIERQNLVVERCSAEGRRDRRAELARHSTDISLEFSVVGTFITGSV